LLLCLFFHPGDLKVLKILILSMTETLIFSHVVDLNETVRFLADSQIPTVVGEHNNGMTDSQRVLRAQG
jgi:hypothetical protein